MAITNPVEIADAEYTASLKITTPLSTAIKQQSNDFNIVDWEQSKQEKASSSAQKKSMNMEKLKGILDDCSTTPSLARALELANEKGSSLWLTTQPCQDHGLFLNKVEFKDALCLRYNW